MPNFTTQYNFNLPLVNNPTDADLWGGYLNANWTALDSLLRGATQLTNLSLSGTLGVTGLLTGGSITATTAISTPKINDTNGNELLIFSTTASAVNEFTINNSSTGNSPQIAATGGDTNIGMTLRVKGSGNFQFRGSTSTAAEIRLFEDEDNGSNYVGLKAPASIASDLTFTLPAADGSANQYAKTNGSGTLSFGNPCKKATSSDQTITTAGQVVFAHGLGVVPDNVILFLVCQTAEFNYTIGQIIKAKDNSSGSASNIYNSVIVDATNVTIRYSSNASCFADANATTGSVVALTNANWKLRIKAIAYE